MSDDSNLLLEVVHHRGARLFAPRLDVAQLVSYGVRGGGAVVVGLAHLALLVKKKVSVSRNVYYVNS